MMSQGSEILFLVGEPWEMVRVMVRCWTKVRVDKINQLAVINECTSYQEVATIGYQDCGNFVRKKNVLKFGDI